MIMKQISEAVTQSYEMLSFIRVVVVMVSLHSTRRPKTAVGPRVWGSAVTGLVRLLFGGM